MSSEFEASLEAALAKFRETYPKAKEREAKGQLRKLYAHACQDLSPLRRRSAGLLLCPPRLQVPHIYWPAVPDEFKAVFQTNLYWHGVGLSVKIPNPDLTQERRSVLEVEANGIVLSFRRQFNPNGDHSYRVSWRMRHDSPLKRHKDALNQVGYFTSRFRQLSDNSIRVLEFLEHTARFALRVYETRGLPPELKYLEGPQV